MLIVPLRVYLCAFGALIALLLLTIAAAYGDFGRLNLIIALVIAVAKMLLILLFFMHLKYGDRIFLLGAGAGFFWLAILLSLTLMDYASRHWLPVLVP